MKVLVTGSGGREHALVWKIKSSPLVDEVICAPGNAGIALIASIRDIKSDSIDRIVKLAKDEKIDLVVIGPEAPLVAGLSDRLESEGILVFGPSSKAAMLEGSKSFTKDLMVKYNVPTAASTSHTSLDEALKEVKKAKRPMVVKADGLAAGKGVMVCKSALEAEKAVRDILEDNQFGFAGSKIIIEEFLEGKEASVMAICDGENILPLIAAQDHKAAYDGDTGPNTGGMGAYAPAPVVTAEVMKTVVEKILKPVVKGMSDMGAPFKGLLYAGLMILDGQPKVLEFNVRFGDPECQPLLMLMKSDIVPLLMNAAKGNLKNEKIEWHDGSVMCVVMASKGYPGSYKKGNTICGLEKVQKDVVVFHAGTSSSDSGIITSGGRVLGVTARGDSLADAARLVYQAADIISWDGATMRRDIGYQALK